MYYTPPEIVRLVADLTLEPLVEGDRAPRVLDPACGAGEFAIEALHKLRTLYSNEAARRGVLAIDIDAQAVATTRRRLKEIEGDFPERNVIVADALEGDTFAPSSFDAVIGNPPYINIRQLAKALPHRQIERLKRTYATARGNFDLYVLFIERAIELLKPGGRCGLIVPGKWATLDYARPCRKLLLDQTTIEQVVDLSDARAFVGANVFPHVLVFQKRKAAVNHTVRFQSFHDGHNTELTQRSLRPAAIHLTPALQIESRVATKALNEVATLSCGTAGYGADKIARRLCDADDEVCSAGQAADFITSGNVDRYAIRLGNVRYLSRDYVRPRLPLDIPELTPAKWCLFTSPKIVIAGMSRRLETAYDQRGLALGVQVFAASDFQVDPFYLLALLNSKLMSFLFATRYAGKRLSGGYLAVNKGQLAQLPIAVPLVRDRVLTKRLSKLAAHWNASLDATIDRDVYELYQLTDTEIEGVEAHFAGQKSRAA